jgi:nucleoside recognition membrane protein YjiH
MVTYLDTALAQIPDISGIFKATLLPTFMICLNLILYVPSFVIITSQQIGNSTAISCN